MPSFGRNAASGRPDARRALRLGRIGQGPGDEVVAVVLEAELPAVEIQCHGGAARSRWSSTPSRRPVPRSSDMLELADCPLGGRPACRRGTVDLARAADAPDRGDLAGSVARRLRRELAPIVSLAIDRPTRSALAGLDALIARAPVGLRLLSGWKVVIAGRPNVGKSRLLNALAGFARAIVDPTPGTTRDVVTLRTSFGGWPVELADTAGLREARPDRELGIERSRSEQREADLVLLVLDRSEPLQSRSTAN